MRTQMRKKLTFFAAMLVAVGFTLCGATYFDRLAPSSSFMWIVAVTGMALGGMLTAGWICDECDSFFERRSALQKSFLGEPHSQPVESWQFDPLDELRAVVYRARPAPLSAGRRSRCAARRAWRGQ